MFEIMTSEASYLRSLNVLINVFLMSPEFGSDMNDRCIVTKRERQFLFSNIGCIRDISAKWEMMMTLVWDIGGGGGRDDDGGGINSFLPPAQSVFNENYTSH